MAGTNAALIIPPSTNTDASFLTNDIRPIRPPVEIPSGWAWLWWTLAVLAVLVGLFFLIRWLLKKQAASQVVAPIPPHIRAKQRLEQALLHLSDTKLFVTLVSDALRIYLEERFNLRAPERTTEEFLSDLQATRHLNAEQKLTLSDFLQRCDLVKFARFEPTEAALRDLYEVASRLVDETRYEQISPVIGTTLTADSSSPGAGTEGDPKPPPPLEGGTAAAQPPLLPAGGASAGASRKSP